MVCFFFFSEDPYALVVQRLEYLQLGPLEHVYMFEQAEGYHYIAYYSYFTCPRLIEADAMQIPTKLVYGVNAHGYPVYWTVWFS
jgi:hypothetical protein